MRRAAERAPDKRRCVVDESVDVERPIDRLVTPSLKML
jgi:hypothetical protein